MPVGYFFDEGDDEPPIEQFETFNHKGYGDGYINQAELPEVLRAEKRSAQNAFKRFLNALSLQPAPPSPQQVEAIAAEERPWVPRMIPGGDRSRGEKMARSLVHAGARVGVAGAVIALRESLELLEFDDEPPDLREFYEKFCELEPLFRDIAKRSDR